MADNLINCVICCKACFKEWTHDEIVADNVAKVEWKVSEAARQYNYPIARNCIVWPRLKWCSVTAPLRPYVFDKSRSILRGGVRDRLGIQHKFSAGEGGG